MSSLLCVRSLLPLLLLLVALPARAASLSLDRGPVVLGRTESVGVTLRLAESPADADRPLRVAVNVGSFGPITRIKPGVYRSIYTPPGTLFPQVALVAIWRETGPDAPIEFLRLPLYGVAKVPVEARRGTEVRMDVGLDSFGPVISDGKRGGTITITVPPGIREVTKHVKDRNGAKGSKKIPIEVPPYNRLTAAAVPSALAPDGRDWARIDVFYDLAGSSSSPSKILVTPELGTVALLSTQRGRYVYRYLPPKGATAKRVKVSIRIEGEPEAHAELELSLQLPPPARVVVRPPVDPLVADGVSNADVAILVLDENGMGLAGQRISLTANGVELPGPVKDLGRGNYRVSMVGPKAYPAGGLVQLAATATGGVGSASGSAHFQLAPPLAPKTVFARFSPSPVPIERLAEARVTFDVRDASGLPLEHASLLLATSHGTIGDPVEVAPGRYEARFTAPAQAPEGDVVIRMIDAAGLFEQAIEVPVREAPKRLMIGVHGTVVHSLGELIAPRGGLELWAPFRLGSTWFGIGAVGSVGKISQTVADPSGQLTSTSQALFAPLGLRLGLELFAGRRISFWLGAEATAVLARFETSLTGRRVEALGFGGRGYSAVTFAAGPGEAFAELSLGTAPVSTPEFHLDAGGLGLAVGYRLGVF